MILAVGLTAFGLLIFPALARPIGRRMPALTWRRLGSSTILTGAVTLVLALVLEAAPTVLRSVGAPGIAHLCERMLGRLAPGGPLVGWTAGLAALLAATGGLVTWRRSRAELAIFRIEPLLGTHFAATDVELVVLPTDRPIAYSRAGIPPQIVVSEGVVDILDEREMGLLVQHERAHLDAGHERLLVMLSVVKGALWWLPGVARSIEATRLAVEREADEAAAGASPERRVTLADALVATVGSCVISPAAAFNAVDHVEERVAAMRGDIPGLPRLAVGAVVGWALSLALTLGAAAGMWVWHADRVVALSGSCVA